MGLPETSPHSLSTMTSDGHKCLNPCCRIGSFSTRIPKSLQIAQRIVPAKYMARIDSPKSSSSSIATFFGFSCALDHLLGKADDEGSYPLKADSTEHGRDSNLQAQRGSSLTGQTRARHIPTSCVHDQGEVAKRELVNSWLAWLQPNAFCGFSLVLCSCSSIKPTRDTISRQ